MQVDIDQELMEAISHPLDENSCFLCATPLNASNRSQEDVIQCGYSATLSSEKRNLFY